MVESGEREELSVRGRESHPTDLDSPSDAVAMHPLHHRHAAELDELELTTVHDERGSVAAIQHATQQVAVRVGVADVDVPDEAHPLLRA
jgi:hypothetical protein